jgi:SNF2 family DNA or RNA helicase
LPWDGGLDLRQKAKLISEWCKTGGILCCSDRTFASTVKAAKDDTKDAKVSEQDRTAMYKGLVNPGPNMITLDEAHTMLKNNNTEIFKALDSIKTQLRLCLTGTPLQNNLMEYYRMSNWTRPGCLGTEVSSLLIAILSYLELSHGIPFQAQFIKKYEKPIMDGMAADCLPSQVEIQEKLSSELHQLLSAFVHRCSKDVLKKVLPFMQEAVIHVRQSKSQTKVRRRFPSVF